MKPATPTTIHVNCVDADVVPSAMSSRWIMASPRPVSATTIGRIVGSAYAAQRRITR